MADIDLLAEGMKTEVRLIINVISARVKQSLLHFIIVVVDLAGRFDIVGDLVSCCYCTSQSPNRSIFAIHLNKTQT